MRFSHRRLPHLYAVGEPVFITFRLHGSLPPGRQFPGGRLSSGQAFVCMDKLLDAQCAGPTYLRMPAIAQVVVAAIQRGASIDYLCHAWVVMPNHIHLLITPQIDPSILLRQLKGVSSREANNLLARTGHPFWQSESYDHVVRNAEEFQRIEDYIIRNPVRAGLAHSPEEYHWSSVSAGGLKPAAG